MTMPTGVYDPTQDFEIALVYQCEDSTDIGAQLLNLSQYGFRFDNVPHMLYNYAERRVPDGALPHPLNPSKFNEPYDLNLITTWFGTTNQEELREQIMTDFFKYIHQAQSGVLDDSGTDYPKYRYLRIGFWNGSAMIYYRLYVSIKGVLFTPMQRQRLEVFDPVVLQCRVVDPMFYDFGEISKTITVAASSGSLVETTGAQRRVLRTSFVVQKTAGDNPQNVVISNDKGETANFNGTLTAGNEYWKLDCVEGRLYRGTSYATETDVTGAQFSGDFPGIDFTGNDTITVSAAGSLAFEVYVNYLKPMF
jgi:hypothetical protein